MAKVRREEIIAAALQLLDEVGLDALTTRGLAQRLGLESATLYYHFRDKAALLDEMAAAALTHHQSTPTPQHVDEWRNWFAGNTRSFRRALLSHRDGARLHAGTKPCRDGLRYLQAKVGYLVRAGFSTRQALMALLTASHFTIGSVLEEQARQAGTPPTAVDTVSRGTPDIEVFAADVEGILTPGGEDAFEFGLSAILDGLRDGDITGDGRCP